MARKPRLDRPGAWHHITNRGARRQATFLHDSDRELFLGLLGKAHCRFGIEVHAYALMGNHFHIVVNTPRAELSAAMQYVGGTYAQAFNDRHGFDGPLFKGRFHSVPIIDDAQLLTTVRYVHLNPQPIHTGPLETYRWSSHPAYLGLTRPPRWLRTDLVMQMLGTGLSAYAHFLDSDGSITSDVTATPITEATPYRAAFEQVDLVLAAMEDVGAAENLARSLTVVVAIDHLGSSPTALADALGYSSRSGAWSALRRARQRVHRDPDFARLVSAVAKRVVGDSADTANTNAA